MSPTVTEEEAAIMEIFHVDGVEPLGQLEDQSLLQDPPKVKNVSEARKEEELVSISPIPIETESTVPEVCEEVEVVALPKVHKEIVVVDISMDTDVSIFYILN